MAYWMAGYESEREEVVEWTSVIQTQEALAMKLNFGVPKGWFLFEEGVQQVADDVGL